MLLQTVISIFQLRKAGTILLLSTLQGLHSLSGAVQSLVLASGQQPVLYYEGITCLDITQKVLCRVTVYVTTTKESAGPTY